VVTPTEYLRDGLFAVDVIAIVVVVVVVVNNDNNNKRTQLSMSQVYRKYFIIHYPDIQAYI